MPCGIDDVEAEVSDSCLLGVIGYLDSLRREIESQRFDVLAVQSSDKRPYQAGADLIVVGNAIEKDATLIKEISQAIHAVPVKV